MESWNRKESDYTILLMRLLRPGLKTIQEYKQLKDLKKESLRDNMTNMELVLNMLAEATTKEISKKEDPKTFQESKKIAVDGGTIAGNTRKDIEKKLGKSVILSENAKSKRKRLSDERNKDIPFEFWKKYDKRIS